MPLPSDPNARKYYRVAMQRYDEAQLILRQLQLFSAAIYLGGYAVECILKALLLANTPVGKRGAMLVSLKQDFGHNLPLLREGLRAQGVNIPRHVLGEITFAASWSPELRYEPGPGNNREAARFLNATRSVVQWADGGLS